MVYVFGAYRLDTQRYELTHAGVPIPLRPKVFQVLSYLLAHHDRVVSKEELLDQLWPGQFVGDVGLNSYIMAVRKALDDRRPPYQYIRTVRGHGYRFVADIELYRDTPHQGAVAVPPLGLPAEPTGDCAPPVPESAAHLIAQRSGWRIEDGSVHRHLPLQLTSFIGRERETADVKSLLATTRAIQFSDRGCKSGLK